MSLVEQSSWGRNSDSKLAVESGDEVRYENLNYTEALIRLYASRARRHARFEDLGEDGWYASVVGLEGVWGEGDSQEAAEDDLETAIAGWLEIKLANGDPIPEMDGIEF